ncbi:MAG: hypothetical protein IJP86_08285 [Synergistaceae bacterium]|nr:hypothetical protein [Synergistaceae bacterium]
MGLFSGIASFCKNAVDTVKSFFSGGSGPALTSAVASYSGGSSHSYTSTTTTTYDPDRVRAAQIDKERAQIENDCVGLMRQAQLDIIEAQTQSRIAQERARAEGFVRIAEAVGDLQERLNELAAQRIAIIERGTLQAVREAEGFYAELMRTIQEDNDRYTAEKLPALLEVLGRYEAGSPAHTLYFKKIDEDITLQAMHTARQLESVLKRQERMIDGIMTDKGKITEQTGNVAAGILEALREKIAGLETVAGQLPAMKEAPALPA